MKDKNGIEIRTGDVVRISGSYFESRNGLYFVRHSPGDADWLGTDHSLQKINRNGTLSKSKYKVEFWPLTSFVSDRCKAAEARRWNNEHAEIEIVNNVDRSMVYNLFVEEADAMSLWIKKDIDYLGYSADHPCVAAHMAMRDHYLDVARRIRCS